MTAYQARLVTDHLHMAAAIARRYTGLGLDLADLTQESHRGLIDAALSYDFNTHHAAFATYARPKCRARIADALAVAGIVHGSERFERDPASARFTRSPIPIDEYGFMPADDDETLAHVEQALEECTDMGRCVLTLVRGLQGHPMTIAAVATQLHMTRAQAQAHHDGACRAIGAAFLRHDWPIPA